MRHNDKAMLDFFVQAAQVSVPGITLRGEEDETLPVVINRKMRRAFLSKMRKARKKNTRR